MKPNIYEMKSSKWNTNLLLTDLTEIYDRLGTKTRQKNDKAIGTILIRKTPLRQQTKNWINRKPIEEDPKIQNQQQQLK